MPEFLRFLRKTITENRPFTGGGSLFESKRGEEIGPIGDWDQNSASSSKKSSCPLSIPKKVIPDGPIRLVHYILDLVCSRLYSKQIKFSPVCEYVIFLHFLVVTFLRMKLISESIQRTLLSFDNTNPRRKPFEKC